MDESHQSHRQREADLLAQVGRLLFGQYLRVRVHLPVALATEAVAAWERDDTDEKDIGSESQAARTTRHRAGDLALIGLAVKERGAPAKHGQVVVDLDAWQIGSALDAAEERGLLVGERPPDGDV